MDLQCIHAKNQSSCLNGNFNFPIYYRTNSWYGNNHRYCEGSKSDTKKKYANPNKNARRTLSIIWENLLNENRNLPIEKEREISPQLKSLNSKLIPIFNILLFLSLVIPGFFDNLHLGISIGYGLFSSSILGMIIRELFNPNRSLQLCYGLFLFWIIVSTILFAMRAWNY
ncbi:hypothetical protein LEP1GSC016_1919 [Leptospira borgpetersenii serovar Hardjo-bovis str. Sponselee]|uniref:Uncharacterized protein n=1 Tax=Leptospira borgpetersenii serovar Hardjo-bovis str. Sponselee TaxID=1303729 RepID=M6BDZ7_LEPBO|nr:hypothetical protein LEP1GSC016_1919 [Leptospira borgpetersenii serovar Hardjo-bovis str. Sponselee]